MLHQFKQKSYYYLKHLTALSSLENNFDNSDNAEEIKGILYIISDKTKLFALNAAIEAARAGKHRCSFAVVAYTGSSTVELVTKVSHI